MSQADAVLFAPTASGNSIAHLSVSDLNTAVNHEPRIAHQRLAEALGYGRHQEMASLITRHREALQRFSVISVTATQNTDIKGRGRPGKTYWLNKKQALYLCTKSETANATEVTIQMVEVFDAYLQGQAPAPAPRRRPKPAPDKVPGFLQSGSDLLKDLILAVKVARVRVQDGHATDPLAALHEVLEDYARKNAGKPTSGKPLGDWNWKRVKGIGNVDLKKASKVMAA